MTGRRQRLEQAHAAGDRLAIAREGWNPVWKLLADIARPKQACTFEDLGSYINLLGDFDPDAIIEAIGEVAGEWRPTPGAIRAYLNGKRGANERVDVGRGRHATDTPEAVNAVIRAMRAGEQPCDCPGAPVSRRWLVSAEAILRCSSCQRIEIGQWYAAEDALAETADERREAAC